MCLFFLRYIRLLYLLCCAFYLACSFNTCCLAQLAHSFSLSRAVLSLHPICISLCGLSLFLFFFYRSSSTSRSVSLYRFYLFIFLSFFAFIYPSLILSNFSPSPSFFRSFPPSSFVSSRRSLFRLSLCIFFSFYLFLYISIAIISLSFSLSFSFSCPVPSILCLSLFHRSPVPLLLCPCLIVPVATPPPNSPFISLCDALSQADTFIILVLKFSQLKDSLSLTFSLSFFLYLTLPYSLASALLSIAIPPFPHLAYSRSLAVPFFGLFLVDSRSQVSRTSSASVLWGLSSMALSLTHR